MYTDPDVYIITDFAKLLGCMAKTLRKWDRQDLLKPYAHDSQGRWYHKDQLGPARDLLAIRLNNGVLPGEKTSVEISKLAGIHVETLYNYVERGLISPHRRHGKMMLWCEDQIQSIKNCWHSRFDLREEEGATL